MVPALGRLPRSVSWTVHCLHRSGATRIRTRHNRWDNFINCPCGSKVTLQAAPGTRVERLVARIEQWIEQGLLKPGERLRSVRAGAAEHGVSKNTMAEVYDRLVAQGLLEARRGSGYYVSHIARPAFDELQPHVVEAIDTVSFLREQLEQNHGVRVGE